MAPRVTWMADSKGQNRKFCMLRSRMHARTHAEFQGLGRLRSRIGRHVESRRVTPDFFCPSCPSWPSEWNSPWEVIAQMAMSSHMQAARLGMILEFLLQNIAIFWSRKNPRWIRGSQAACTNSLLGNLSEIHLSLNWIKSKRVCVLKLDKI
jgi:hypothetical protein